MGNVDDDVEGGRNVGQVGLVIGRRCDGWSNEKDNDRWNDIAVGSLSSHVGEGGEK